MEIIEGNLIDIENREFYPCAISIFEGKIMNIESTAAPDTSSGSADAE